MCDGMCVLTGWATFALIDFLPVTQIAKVNKGSGVIGYFWDLVWTGDAVYILPRAVVVKPESCGLEQGKNWDMLMMRLEAV